MVQDRDLGDENDAPQPEPTAETLMKCIFDVNRICSEDEQCCLNNEELG